MEDPLYEYHYLPISSYLGTEPLEQELEIWKGWGKEDSWEFDGQVTPDALQSNSRPKLYRFRRLKA